MATTGQTINDRLNAVRYALVGQGLARTVCKATTEEVLGPKKKHIDYLLACTNEPNVSIPQMANLLIERTQHTSWAVVFKSLISIHHLMSYGNERFTQYLATSNHSFNLSDFMDRTTPQGYNMSTFVRRYAKYINDKSISYRTLAIDLCKIRSGNDNALRTMNMENLSKTLPIVQAQFDSMLEFGAEVKDLNNGIIMAAFRLLYKDLVRLYVAYQEAIINLLERFFKLSRKKSREALELYKNYLARMDKVAAFLRVVDGVGLDKSEMPDLTKSPASILKLLEQHLSQLEAKKRGGTSSVSPDQQQQDEEEGDGNGGEENKENEPSVAESSDDKTASEQKGLPTTSDGQVPAGPSSASVSDEKPPAVAPQKPQKPPARPTSPKVSSPESERPKAAPAAVVAPEKKGPPERPAKPPSRPPPPAAPSTATATSSSSQAAASSGSSGGDSGNHEEASKGSKLPTAPPHPPPPPQQQQQQHPAQQASPTSSTATEAQQAREATSNENSSNAGGQAVSAASEEQATGSSCSAAVNQEGGSTTTSQQPTDSQETNHKDLATTAETQAAEINHVNGGLDEPAAQQDQQEQQVEMPPPPPPIDDGEEEVAAAGEAPAAEAVVVQPEAQEPNGEVPTNGDGEHNNNNAAAAAPAVE